jgi:DTW domain-containing protein YfiP
MNLKQYLAKRKHEKAEFERVPRRDVCHSCLRPPEACFCEHIRPFETNFEFVLLMHPKEFKKEPIGTGRYTNKALKNCQIIVDATFDENKQLQSILNDENRKVFLLYPGEDSINISESQNSELNVLLEDGKQPVILIIDGTWACAKSMMRDSHCLHNLPRLSFSTSITSKFHIKLQPADYCLSTIESVYVLLDELEKRGLEKIGEKKEILLQTLDRMVQFQVQCANDPNKKGYRRGQFKSKEQRQIPKKWDYRKICFEEKNYS